ncbi:MAG: ABC transporter permease [Clostridia bacterium]|nr:ABC transporter permease [Clostridia bacterium]
MYNYILAVKRTLRSVYFPTLLIIFAFALIASVSLGESESMPIAGVCDFDESVSSKNIVKHLSENGFELCTDEKELREKVSSGEYNCGVIIPKGFNELLMSDNIDKSVTFITSPSSFLLSIYSNHVMTAIFSEYAPIISANSITDTTITADEVIAEYRDMMADGAPFTFAVEYVEADGESSPQAPDRSRTYSLAVASLLILVMLMYGVCDLVTKDIEACSHRIGMKNTLIHSVIPNMSVRIIGIMLATITAAFVSFLINKNTTLTELFLPIFLYSLAIATLALFAAAIFRSAARIQIFTFFLFILGLVLCPIYIDISLLLSTVKYIRLFTAPYWLWIFADNPFYALIPVILLPISCLALYKRFAKKPVK